MSHPHTTPTCIPSATYFFHQNIWIFHSLRLRVWDPFRCSVQLQELGLIRIVPPILICIPQIFNHGLPELVVLKCGKYTQLWITTYSKRCNTSFSNSPNIIACLCILIMTLFLPLTDHIVLLLPCVDGFVQFSLLTLNSLLHLHYVCRKNFKLLVKHQDQLFDERFFGGND